MATNSNQMAYNEGEIKTCLSNISAGYTDLVTAIGTSMQNKVIHAFGQVWYATNAKSYWDEEVTSWNSMCGQIRSRFVVINDMINTCASNYATAAGTTWSKQQFNGDTAKVTNEVTDKRGDGYVGIVDIGTFKTIKDTTINTIKDDADTALNKVLSACDASGFIDSSTEETIRSIINTIKTNITTAINTAKEDIAKNSGTAESNFESARSANASSSAS